MTLKQDYEKLKEEYYRDAEEVCRVTDYRGGILYMGCACDQSDRRKQAWLQARDDFVQAYMGEINRRASDILIADIGEEII